MKTEQVSDIDTRSIAFLGGVDDQVTFPVRSDIAQGESGQGYALRMAVANGIAGLPALKSWRGKSRFAVLDSDDTIALANWFGAEPRRLSQALGELSLKGASSGYRFGGATLDRSYFVNRAYPRVCPECLEESHVCMQSWEVSVTAACHRHKTALIDHCIACNRRLTWNRPAIDACKCGQRLCLAPGRSGPTSLELEVAAWTEARILGDEVVRGSHALSRLISPLTLNGGLHLIFALGTAEKYDSDGQGRAVRNRSSLAFTKQMLADASQLLEKLESGTSVELGISVPSVVLRLLAEVATSDASPEDRSLSHSLINVLLKMKARSRSSSVLPQLAQIELF
ncbi:MAG: TniQ family protein [Hylemonella sp.]|uniref:TniQ family protein n=1 Tax=Hylemonella sp. TaxID=2066020 RepID=UPI00391A44B6